MSFFCLIDSEGTVLHFGFFVGENSHGMCDYAETYEVKRYFIKSIVLLIMFRPRQKWCKSDAPCGRYAKFPENRFSPISKVLGAADANARYRKKWYGKK